MNETAYDRALNAFTSASEMEDAGDIASAIFLYKTAGRMNFSPAYTNLGNIYDDKISPSDPRKAVYYYKKAASLGDATGAYCLAIHYRNLNDRRWYNFWLHRAAHMGYDDAVQELGHEMR